MYAIIETGGKQYKVQPGDVIDIERLIVGDDNSVEFDKVLAVGGDSLTVGAPTVEGAKVTAELVEDFRGKKLVVFKMKRRKGNRRKNGHRQELSKVKILDIQTA
jgi:large subunit ribosomal protein L21